MPYVKTGRPPGRPKTKEYETLTARVPQDMADQAREYATRHRQSLSDVLRDGLHVLLEEDRYKPFMSDTNREQEYVSDANGTLENKSDTIPTESALGIMSDMNGAPLALENASDTNSPPEKRADTLRMQRLREIVSDTNDAPQVSDVEPTPVPLDTADLDAIPFEPDVVPAEHPVVAGEGLPSAEACPPFDPVKYRLGQLCKAGHAYGTTGQSLRVNNKAGYCLACNRAIKRDKRQARSAGAVA